MAKKKKVCPLQCVQFPHSGDVSGVRVRRFLVVNTEAGHGAEERGDGHLFTMLFVWQPGRVAMEKHCLWGKYSSH